MRIKKIRQTLWCVTVMCLTAGIASLVASVCLPFDEPDVDVIRMPAELRNRPAEDTARPEIRLFAAFWERNLRPPLFDPPAESDTKEDAPSISKVRKPDIKLLGYAVEDGRSLAILLAPDNTVSLIAEGEQCHGVTVQSITTAGVTLEFRGDRFILHFDEPEEHDTSNQRADRSHTDPGGYR
jgi:hypothetical protein